MRYYLFLDKHLARRSEDGLTTEWYEKGQWIINHERTLQLDDAMMDFGDFSVGDYKNITSEQAKEYTKN